MDEFGVLVESIGFKSNKSTPLADLKSKNKINNGGSRSFVINSTFDAKPTSLNRPKSANTSSSINGSFDVDLDGIFRSNTNKKTQNYDGFDDVFGGGSVKGSNPSGGDGFDFDSIFMGSNNSSVNSSVYDNDDIFGGMPGMKSSVASPAKESSPIDDLLGNFDGMGLGSHGSRKNSVEMEKTVQEFDDLIPGFRGSSPSTNRANSSKPTTTSAKVHFAVPKQSPSGLFSASVEQDARENFVFSSVDELEDFAMGNVRNNANKRSEYFQREKVEKTTPDLDAFFGMGPSNGSRNKSTTVDPVFDSLFQSRGTPGVEQNPSRSSSNAKKASSNSSNRKKATSATNIVDDFSFFFEAAPSPGEFQEIEGESEERRRARLNQHTRTQQRMAKALAEKNQRDLQTRQEQEEKHRIGETLDGDIKRWAVGKEGNLRALLSSLQYVLWPECGWQQVSLTDLITSISVKKVYFKATLCVHPDKVQQKGATIEQKYIAEKVFDLLKEAWNKFNSEEL